MIHAFDLHTQAELPRSLAGAPKAYLGPKISVASQWAIKMAAVAREEMGPEYVFATTMDAISIVTHSIYAYYCLFASKYY